jgi:hypothetical protein
MKTLTLLLVAAVLPLSLRANPELRAAVAHSFGEAQAAKIILVQATPNAADPQQWTVYAADAFRPTQQVRSIVTLAGGAWKADPAGAGSLLNRTPPAPLDFNRVKVRSSAARDAAARVAAAANTSFASTAYQLATNEAGSPEWGLALNDGTGYEVGFCVVNAESGVVTFTSWTPRGGQPTTTGTDTDLSSEGRRAAQKVKEKSRQAWNWTEKAGRETGNFFKELFKRDR